MSDGYQILSLDEIEPVPYHAREGQKLLTIQRLLDYRAAGINGWIGDPGESLVPEHEEDSGNEELYVVVRGRAAFTVDGERIDAPAGTLIHVLSGEKRTAVSEEAGTIVVAIGATIGQANEPSGWTGFVVADALRRDGRVDEGRTVIREMIDRFPDAWHAPYNAACYEALAGNPDEAFELLRQAQRMNPNEIRRYLEGDSDLDSLRDDPRFQELLA
jgi:quercetin dioxygenase-like cupin family protein